jgi:two-component system response regulator RegA
MNERLPEERSLLIVDDDAPFRRQITRAMERRGFETFAAEGVQEAIDLTRQEHPVFAVVDMRLEDGNGLDLVPQLVEICPNIKIVMLTGYGNIASAVSAIKVGALDYLAKPADADDIVKALLSKGDEKPAPPENPMSADRVRWEHIQRVYELCDRNVSETARRLNMHRRTLQRILAKRSPQ